jgi:hypothetical protein
MPLDMLDVKRPLLLIAFLTSGCVDPEARFEAFAKRAAPDIPDATPGDGGTCTVEPGSVQGEYLLALSVTLAPTKPIVATVQIDTPVHGEGTGLTLDAQPLRSADRRTPVGEPIVLGPFPVDAEGGYRAEVPGLEITGEANPVTGGDISASAVLAGNLCGDGRFFCGTLSGAVEKPLPLDLAGSTFTLTRIEPGGPWPDQPAVDCAGTLADPL